MSPRLSWLSISAICLAFYGCTDATKPTDTAAVHSATSVAFNTSGAPTVEFSVPDMMCPEGCGEKTKEILAGQPGAKDVMIDFEGKRAVVAVEAEEFNADAALAAMIDHGFDHTTLRQVAESPETN